MPHGELPAHLGMLGGGAMIAGRIMHLPCGLWILAGLDEQHLFPSQREPACERPAARTGPYDDEVERRILPAFRLFEHGLNGRIFRGLHTGCLWLIHKIGRSAGLLLPDSERLEECDERLLVLVVLLRIWVERLTEEMAAIQHEIRALARIQKCLTGPL